MKTSHPAQFSFIGGEQSPLMLSSSIKANEPRDTCASIENMVLMKDGPVARRRGSASVAITNPGLRMIPFLGDLLLFGSAGGISGLCVRSLGPQDDDMALLVNGNVLSNTRLNIAKYNGAQEGVSNPSFLTSGFRELRFRRPDSTYNPAHVKLFPFTLNWGDLIGVYTFDGWGSNWGTSPWEATIYFGNGVTRVVTGGSTTTGPSIMPYDGSPGYFDAPYHFEDLRPNGSFLLTY